MGDLFDTIDRTIGVVGVLFGILGLLSGIYFYVKSKRFRAPTYKLWDSVVLSPRDTRFTIQYDGSPVRWPVRRAVVDFWNAGNDTISGSDIAEADPTRIIFPDASRIFEVEVVGTSRSAINFDRIWSGLVVELTFDFLDQGDGGRINVLYECGCDSLPEIVGTVKGASKGLRDGATTPPLPRWLYRLGFLLVFASGIVAIVQGKIQLNSDPSARIAEFISFLANLPLSAPLGLAVIVWIIAIALKIRLRPSKFVSSDPANCEEA